MGHGNSRNRNGYLPVTYSIFYLPKTVRIQLYAFWD